MSTDTPRTDAEALSITPEEGVHLDLNPDVEAVVPAQLARTLERELTAMTAERDALRAALDVAFRFIDVATFESGNKNIDVGIIEGANICTVLGSPTFDELAAARAALNHRKP